MCLYIIHIYEYSIQTCMIFVKLYIYIYIYVVSPSASPGSLESTRPGRELVTTCRSSGSTPRGRKPTLCVPVGRCSYGWPLP